MLEKLLGEATRLTHAGRLAEATAAIQRMLHGGSPVVSANERRDDDDVLDGLVREVDRQSQATPTPAKPPPAFREPMPPHRDRAVPDRGRGPSRFESGSFTGTSGTRSYKLFVPAAAAGQSLPLVVMLHGCKQSPDDFAAGTRMNEVAEERGFLVLYPAQAPRSNSSKCWNWFMPGDQRRGAGEPELLAGMTRQIIEAHGVDRARVYVAGLSAGAAMADILSREYPELYAAAGIHSGLPQGAAHDVASAFAAMQNGTGKKSSASGLRPESRFAPVAPSSSAACGADAARAPAIVFHGDRDSTVHPRNGEHVIGAVLDGAGDPDGVAVSTRKASLGGRAVTQSVHRRADAAVGEPSLAEHWVIHGGGHAWSGGSPAGSYTDATGPDASREMLRFFEEHPLRGA